VFLPTEGYHWGRVEVFGVLSARVLGSSQIEDKCHRCLPAALLMGWIIFLSTSRLEDAQSIDLSREIHPVTSSFLLLPLGS